MIPVSYPQEAGIPVLEENCSEYGKFFLTAEAVHGTRKRLDAVIESEGNAKLREWARKAGFEEQEVMSSLRGLAEFFAAVSDVPVAMLICFK